MTQLEEETSEMSGSAIVRLEIDESAVEIDLFRAVRVDKKSLQLGRAIPKT